jgi:phosphoadenosine phosphosulfate reductase
MSHLPANLFRRLRDIARRFPNAALASSLSAEDMVITDAIAATGGAIAVFVIDTGRLHAETLDLLQRAESRYGIEIEVVRPNEDAVRDYVEQHGLNAFYESVELRHSCCDIRKVDPLQRALAGRDAWLTGQRRAHGPERTALALEEFDAAHGIAKFNPLAQWSDEELWRYVRDNDVPVNALHARDAATHQTVGAGMLCGAATQ